jgi:hypothetical protein
VELIGLVLIVVGIAVIALGALRIRGPLATIRRLDATEANLQRYETWRGRTTDVETEGPTGADEMRALMRQRAIIWGVLIGAGVVLIASGLLSRAG